MSLGTFGAIAGGVFGGPIGAALGGMVGEGLSSAWQADRQGDMADHAMNQSRDNMLIQQQFQERMSNTQWQRARADIEAAGFNPALAYEKGGAGTPAGGSASGGQMGSVSKPEIAAAANSAADVMVKDKMAQKLEAEKDEIVARTPTHAQSIEESKQRIAESVRKMEVMSTEMMRNVSSAGHFDQQVQNLAAQLPLIKAETAKLWKQVEYMNQQISLAKSQGKEIDQRIAANLPKAEALLKDLEAKLKEMSQPKAMQDAALHEGFLGTMSAVIRAFTGLGSIR